MAIRIKYGNPIEVARVLRDARAQLEEEAAANEMDGFGQALEQQRRQSRPSRRSIPPVSPRERLERSIASRNRQTREIENEGRRAARERREASRTRSQRPLVPRDDEYLDMREFARLQFESQLEGRADADAYYRGQNGELMGDLFDPERDEPGAGFAYTEAQRMELQRIAATANELASDPTLTEEERYRGLVQLQNKRDLIRPNREEEKQPSIQEQWDSSTIGVYDPQTGDYLGIGGQDRNGAWRMVYSKPKPTEPEPSPDPAAEYRKERAEAYKDARKLAIEQLQMTTADGESITEAAIAAATNRILADQLGPMPGQDAGEMPPESPEEAESRRLRVLNQLGPNVPRSAVEQPEGQSIIDALAQMQDESGQVPDEQADVARELLRRLMNMPVRREVLP
jgi:hypothetical protein